MQNVLIVEDHPESRRWLESLVAEALPNLQPTSAATLAQGWAAVAGQSFSLTLVDLSLPDGSGTDLIHHLARHAPDTFVVVVSIYDDDRHLLDALQAGASGYLLKDCPREQLLSQLHGILNGDPPLSPQVARRMLRLFRDPPAAPCNEEELSQLSARELEVLSLLARGHTRQDIAMALEIRPNTVAGYIKSIYQKLDVSGRAEATLEAVRLGIVRAHA